MRARCFGWLALATLAMGCGGEGAQAGPADATAHSDAAGDAAEDATLADAASDAGGDTTSSVNPLVPPAGGYAAIFLDVGQGDATLLIAADGTTALIDGGLSADTLRKRLHRLGVSRVDYVIATHADADHIGGLPAVLQDFAVSKVLWNGVGKDTQIFESFLDLAAKEPGATVTVAARASAHPLGNLSLEVLHPAAGVAAAGDHNNQSVVVLTGCSGAWLLLPGDAEQPAEADMLSAGLLSDVDVLHVGHHGSASGTTTAFLDEVTPEHAVISAGVVNSYGHPDPGVVARLEGRGAKVWRTDLGWDDDTVWMHADCKGGLTFGRVQ